LTQEEAERILKGLGKKRTPDPLIRTVTAPQNAQESRERGDKERDFLEDLDVPTIFRKKSDPKNA
jgi:hypothetical protein